MSTPKMVNIKTCHELMKENISKLTWHWFYFSEQCKNKLYDSSGLKTALGLQLWCLNVSIVFRAAACLW